MPHNTTGDEVAGSQALLTEAFFEMIDSEPQKLASFVRGRMSLAIASDRLPIKDRLREVREEFILDAVNELLADRGYAEMSMDEVAARTGMSKATIYQLFASKQEVALGVVLRNLRAGVSLLEAALAERKPWLSLEDAVRDALRNRFQFAEGRFQIPPTVLQDDLRYKALVTTIRQLLAEIIEAGKQAGYFAPDLSAPVAAAMCQALCHANFDADTPHSGCGGTPIDVAVAILFRGFRAGGLTPLNNSPGLKEEELASGRTHSSAS